MPRNKLKKYAEIEVLPNVIHRDDSLRGSWNKAFFQNENPITLELGCGAGTLTLELARRNPDQNFIGVDNKRARVWSGAKIALDENLKNVAFITARIETLDEYFACNEVSQIWVTFPDPYPKPSKSNKRLISPRMLKIYRNIISDNCIFHLKTDDMRLFNFVISILKNEGASIHQISQNTHEDPEVPEEVGIITVYEKMHLDEGKNIKYVRFSIDQQNLGRKTVTIED